NAQIPTARSDTKPRPPTLATFHTPNHGPIGFLTKHSLQYHHQVAHQDQFDEVDLGYKVGLIKAHAGLDGTFFDALTEADYHGLLLEALGQGNMPPSALSGLQKV